MDLTEFTELLDRNGGDLERWPGPARAAGEALLRDSSEARAALAAAQRIEGLLAEATHRAPSHLAGRIVANVADQLPATTLLDWFAGSFWRLAVSALLPLAIGFGVGAYAPADSADYVALDASVFADNVDQFQIEEVQTDEL